MPSALATYFQRTARLVGKGISDMILMKGADPIGKARTVFVFNTPEHIKLFATGCDGDVGGLSTVNFDLETRPEINKPIEKEATGVFWGHMRLQVKPGLEGKVRAGWAGFRNKTRPTMFGNMLEDASGYDYLALRLRAGGDPKTHNSYFVNVQTDGAVAADLWQHRLYFRKADNSWEDIYIPFNNFVRTNSGEMSEFQMEMMKERIRSIGISLLTGNSAVEGKYELGIDSIRLVNEEDLMDTHSSTEKSSSEKEVFQ